MIDYITWRRRWGHSLKTFPWRTLSNWSWSLQHTWSICIWGIAPCPMCGWPSALCTHPLGNPLLSNLAWWCPRRRALLIRCGGCSWIYATGWSKSSWTCFGSSGSFTADFLMLFTGIRCLCSTFCPSIWTSSSLVTWRSLEATFLANFWRARSSKPLFSCFYYLYSWVFGLLFASV